MTRPNMRRGLLAAAMGFTVLATAPGVSNAALEAKMYAITIWNAGCSGGQRDAWDDMVQAWYDEITDAGTSVFGICLWGHCGEAFTRDGSLVNSTNRNSRFADSSLVSFGVDSSNLDEADAAMIGTHGADSAGVWVGSMRVDEAGAGDCNLRRDEMELGDTDLEFLHLSSCNSMDANQWSGSWWRAFRGLHQVDGFHGFMWIGNGLIGNYENFADDAFDGSIADAWLDNHYVVDISGSDDQCPVAYAVGANQADAINRLHTERYDNVFGDPTAVAWWQVTYVGGCDPANETAL